MKINAAGEREFTLTVFFIIALYCICVSYKPSAGKEKEVNQQLNLSGKSQIIIHCVWVVLLSGESNIKS